jgi:hypothetical protein
MACGAVNEAARLDVCTMEGDLGGGNGVRAMRLCCAHATRGSAGAGAAAAERAIVFGSLSTGFPRFSALIVACSAPTILIGCDLSHDETLKSL